MVKNFRELISRTLERNRGYKYSKYRTELQKGTETEAKIFKLYHWRTLILKAMQIGLKKEEKAVFKHEWVGGERKRVELTEEQQKALESENDDYFSLVYTEEAWELLEWGGWSKSDVDSINRALSALGIENARASGVGMFNTGRLEFWYQNYPVNELLQPKIDKTAFLKSLEPLFELFGRNSFEIGCFEDIYLYGGTNRNNGEKLTISPMMRIKVLDSRNGQGLDRFNGFEGNSCAVVEFNHDLSQRGVTSHGTRLILKTDEGNLRVYSVSRKYHSTCGKALEFITRGADHTKSSLFSEKKPNSPFISKRLVLGLV